MNSGVFSNLKSGVALANTPKPPKKKRGVCIAFDCGRILAKKINKITPHAGNVSIIGAFHHCSFIFY